jgi:hypothetical protein
MVMHRPVHSGVAGWFGSRFDALKVGGLGRRRPSHRQNWCHAEGSASPDQGADLGPKVQVALVGAIGFLSSSVPIRGIYSERFRM